MMPDSLEMSKRHPSHSHSALGGALVHTWHIKRFGKLYCPSSSRNVVTHSGSLSWTKVILNSLIMAKLAWNFDWKFGSANDVDFKRDARLLGLWRPPPLRVCYTPVVREDEE